MALEIDDEDVVELVRRLAQKRNVDLTEAVRLAVKHELEGSARGEPPRRERLRIIAKRIAASPLRNLRSMEELLGYDEDGLPG